MMTQKRMESLLTRSRVVYESRYSCSSATGQGRARPRSSGMDHGVGCRVPGVIVGRVGGASPGHPIHHVHGAGERRLLTVWFFDLIA